MSLTNALLIVTICLLLLLIGFALLLARRGRREYSYFRYLLEQDHYHRDRYGPYRWRVFDSPLFGLIERAERNNAVNLSWAAREMLIIPVAEQIEDGRPVEWEQVQTSLDKIVSTISESSSDSEMSERGRHNAVAVIKAFYKRFCDIPPFCKPTGETSEGSR
jgi:hypothetical protein